MTSLPETVETEEKLEEILTDPSDALVESLAGWGGTTAILGVGGKMGTHLALMLQKAQERAGSSGRILAVSRFSDPAVRRRLDESGIETIAADLLEPDAVSGLPDADRVVYMAGRKFGTDGAESLTWAMNVLVPDYVCRRYAGVPTVAYSTGAVYDRVPVVSGGATEAAPLTPLGEYANAAVGRERIFRYAGEKTRTPICLFRLFYSNDLRYGVVRDVGDAVFRGDPVELEMGNANVIWQGDAVDQSLRAFPFCEIPARPLNVTGPETVSIRYVAERFAFYFGKEVSFTGEPAADALLGNASLAAGRFGYPRLPLETMIRWTARWIEVGGRSLGKPTHFEVRNGRY